MILNIFDLYEKYEKLTWNSPERAILAQTMREDLKNNHAQYEDVLEPPWNWRTIVREENRGLFRDGDGALHVAEVAIWGELPDVRLSDCSFFCIITIECEQYISLQHLYPPKVYTRWDITEKENDDISIFDGGKYRKVVGEFSYTEFINYCDTHDIHYECETMGSLSMYGHMPALSFESACWSEDGYAINIYVTSIPDFEPPESEREQVLIWEALSQQLKEI